MRSMTSLFRAGSNGSKVMVPFFRTPMGTVTSTASPTPPRSLSNKVGTPHFLELRFAV